jgi:hypothetical protein
MQIRKTALVFALLAVPSIASAQDFGIMESAEIIQPGNLKLTAYPVFSVEDTDGSDIGGVIRAGYGFSDRVDGELGFAFYDSSYLIGANLELALLKAVRSGGRVDASARGGLHFLTGDGEDAVGLDLAGLLSTHVTRNLEVVGAIDYNHIFFDEPIGDVNTVHLVPGFEYRLGRSVDLLGEFGIGLDEDAANYLAVGLAVYFR